MSSETAHVILMRPRPMGFEVFVVRRQGVGFGFPGGAIRHNEDVRVAAARVLFEDCTVLLGRDVGHAAQTLEMPSLPALRRKILGGANATEALRAAGFTWASEAVFAWSQWRSPSSTGLSSPGIRIDGGGASARLLVVRLPMGMSPAFEADEVAEPAWIRPSEAAVRADELLLAPHAIRTCWELERFDQIEEVFEAAQQRAGEHHAILPRLGPNFSLLLPWDREYATAGQGESLPFSFHPKWANGPSRFVREDRTWKLVDGPGSNPAG